jgi:hypothetical protein
VALVGVVLLTTVGLAVTGAFFTAGVPAVVVVAGVALVAAGVARTSFAGAFLTGVAPVFAATGVEEAGVVFLTGVVFGVVTVGFFATFSIPLTPATNKGSALQDIEEEGKKGDKITCMLQHNQTETLTLKRSSLAFEIANG